MLEKDRERYQSGKKEEPSGRLKKWSELGNLSRIQTMEAYDISNISGFLSVGSMVVYEKGKPKRSDYRKFRIKRVQRTK